MIFSARTRANQPISAAADEGTDTCPQLIIASATLRNHLKKYVMEEKGWIRMNRMIRVTGIGLDVDPAEDGEWEVVGQDNRQRRVTHTALVVTNDGGVRNIDGAVPPEQASSAEDDSRTFEEQATDILEGTHEVQIDKVQASE
jgi:hypothetical protein